jgi:hypothetical protein
MRRTVVAKAHVGPFAHVDQPTASVAHLLPADPQERVRLRVKGRCGDERRVHVRLVEVQLVLIDRPRPADAPRLDPALQLDEHARVGREVRVRVSHVALEPVDVRFDLGLAPELVLVTLDPLTRLAAKREKRVVAVPEAHVLDRVPEVVAHVGRAQPGPVLVVTEKPIRSRVVRLLRPRADGRGEDP